MSREMIHLKELNLSINPDAVVGVQWNQNGYHVVHLTAAINLISDNIRIGGEEIVDVTVKNVVAISDERDKKTLEDYFQLPHLY